MSKLILITGAPAIGKTTLLNSISEQFSIPSLSIRKITDVLS